MRCLFCRCHFHSKENCQDEAVTQIQTQHVSNVNRIYSNACVRRISGDDFKTEIKRYLNVNYTVIKLKMIIEHYKRSTGIKYHYGSVKDSIIRAIVLYVCGSVNILYLNNLYTHSLTRIATPTQRPVENVVQPSTANRISSTVRYEEPIENNQNENPNLQQTQRQPLPTTNTPPPQIQGQQTLPRETLDFFSTLPTIANRNWFPATLIEEIEIETNNMSSSTVRLEETPNFASTSLPQNVNIVAEQVPTPQNTTPVNSPSPAVVRPPEVVSIDIEPAWIQARPTATLRPRETTVIPTPQYRNATNFEINTLMASSARSLEQENFRLRNQPPRAASQRRAVNSPQPRNIPPAQPRPTRSLNQAKYTVYQFNEKCNREDNDGECPICYENMEDETFVKLNCSHQFCKKCIKNCLFLNQFKCPMCRTQISKVYTQHPVVSLSI